ncbi:MAG: hypothetical protein ABL907_00450 [Hyphomicrobium sp.]
MSIRLSRILRPASAVASLLALVVGAGVVMQSSETMLRSSFARALSPASNAVAEQAVAIAKVPLSGSEDFWLTAMHQDAAVPVSKSISLGDLISLRLNGEDRHYRVTSVAEFTPGKTEIDTRSANVRLVLVTATDTANVTSRPIRFVMEVEGTPVAVISGQPARAS